jgi:membrane-bound lytic murein transglycosylase D
MKPDAYTQYANQTNVKSHFRLKSPAVADTANWLAICEDCTAKKTTYYGKAKVKRGDNLSMIASKYDVDVSDIKNE